MREFTTDWFSGHASHWDRLYAQRNPKKYLEIGSWEGRSALWALDKGMEVYCVDNWGSPASERLFDSNTAGYANLHKLKGDSQRVLPAMYEEHLDSFDFIFVDGSHKAVDVLTDLINVFPMAKVGALIIADDYLFKEDEIDPRNRPKWGIDIFMNLYAERLHVLRDKPLWQLFMEKM